MINDGTFITQETLFCRLAHNILADSDDITACIDSARQSAANSKQSYSSQLNLKLIRHFSFQKYMSKALKANETCNTNMLSILGELDGVASNTSEEEIENIIPLQLSDILDKFIHSLSSMQQRVYIKRYFFADSLDDIATACHTTKDNINSTLNKCNSALKNHLSAMKYVVKKETLFQSFTDIGDDLISANIDDNILNNISSNTEHKHKKKAPIYIKKYIPYIVGLLVGIALCIGFIFLFGDDEPEPATDNNISPRFEHLIKNDESGEYLITNELLTYATENPENYLDGIDLHTVHFNLNYMGYELTDTSMLPYCVGTEREDFSNGNRHYYTLLGHKDIQYLIKKEGDSYSLYKLYTVEVSANSPTGETTATGEYVPACTYGDLLSEVYDIHEANDISHISYYPLYELIYLEVGSSPNQNYVYEFNKIEGFFHIISNMQCTTSDVWTSISTGEYSYVDLENTSLKLSLTTAHGEVIDTLCYRYSDRYFFDYMGIEYGQVSEGAHTALQEIMPFPSDDVLLPYVATDPTTWNLVLKAHGATSTQLTIGFEHQTRNYTVDLYTSDWYFLERFENDSWVEVPTIIESELSKEYDPQKNKIPANSSYYIALFWEDTYGKLSPGLYRITKSVANPDTGNPDEYIEALFSAEFEITE